MYLFLDDERSPAHVTWSALPRLRGDDEWVIVRNYDEFVKAIESYYESTHELPKFISFDHDLGTKLSGADCALWYVNFCFHNNIKPPHFAVHSMNPIGKLNIQCIIESFIRMYDKVNSR